MKIPPTKCGSAVALLFAVLVSSPAFAETEVLHPVEDTYIQGGTRSAELAVEPHSLIVAARSQDGFENVRKVFLLFETFSNTDDVQAATLVLTYGPRAIVANEGDPKIPIEILLYGAPGGDWSEKELTWDSAPFHDPQSLSDEATPGLELLARIPIDTAAVNVDDVLKFSDPRLTDFVRKHPGRVTFVLTSLAGQKSPGVAFFDRAGTGRPERLPQLILDLK
jgi:hypothetical protein